MTDNYIGPITISTKHVIDGDKINIDGSETINLVVTPTQAKQLKGLCESSVKNKYGDLTIIKGVNTRWGIVPLDTFVGIEINEYLSHKGYYQLTSLTETYLNPLYSEIAIEAEKISSNFNEFLTLLYSKGGEDGAEIESTYEDLTTTTVFEDDFTGTYTDNWTTYEEYYVTSDSVTTSGGKLVFTGTKTGSPSYGGWGRMKIYSDSTYAPPWTLEFDLEATSGVYNHLNLLMVQSVPQSWNLLTNVSTSNYIRFYINTNSSGTITYAVSRAKAGASTALIPKTTLSSGSTVSFKVKYYEDGDMEVYIDPTGTGTFNSEPDWGRATSGFTWTSPAFIYNFNTASTSAGSASSGNFKIYTESEANKPNVVIAPPDAVYNTTADFTRASEDGNIQCFTNPLDPINYQITPANFYKGTVKAMNGNYTDSTYRLITDNEVELSATKFYVSNGLVKLVTTTDSVEFHYWNGSAYVKLNEFTLPQNISLIRPFHVTPWEFTLQLDRTYWTIRAGKPYIWVKHENDALDYTLNTCYYHDAGTTEDPIADADITMDDQFYTLVWDKGAGTCASPSPSQSYRLMLIKKDPTTIKSDNIPASSMTGIGWYNATLDSDNVNGYLTLAREWHKTTRQTLAIQGV